MRNPFHIIVFTNQSTMKLSTFIKMTGKKKQGMMLLIIKRAINDQRKLIGLKPLK